MSPATVYYVCPLLSEGAEDEAVPVNMHEIYSKGGDFICNNRFVPTASVV
jgi:hypothetical protein